MNTFMHQRRRLLLSSAAWVGCCAALAAARPARAFQVQEMSPGSAVGSTIRITTCQRDTSDGSSRAHMAREPPVGWSSTTASPSPCTSYATFAPPTGPSRRQGVVVRRRGASFFDGQRQAINGPPQRAQRRRRGQRLS